MKGPDKGSFPLDHFHECDTDAKKYSLCLAKHQLMPKRCRQFQVDYLKCRMGKYDSRFILRGLMDKTEVEKLGFTENLSWESEEQEKQFLFDKIGRLKNKAAKSYDMQQEFIKESKQPPQKEE